MNETIFWSFVDKKQLLFWADQTKWARMLQQQRKIKKIRRRIFLGTRIQHDEEIKSTIKQQTDETTTNLIQSN